MSDNLKVAIIGYGLAGSVFHAPLIAATPGLEVSAIVTSRPQAARDFPHAHILPRAEDVWGGRYDLVVIATPNRSHASLGMAALEAGFPVVIDKPMATSVADGQGLIDVAKRTGKLLTVFQNRRWDNDFLTLRRLLADQVLGPLTRFESRYERYRSLRSEAWRESAAPEDAGGVLFDLGAHVLDQVIVLFGAPRSLYAEVYHRRPGTLVDDDCFVALDYPDFPVHCWMNVAATLVGPRFKVMGLEGAYEKSGVDPQEEALRAGLRPGNRGWGLEPSAARGRLLRTVGGLRTEGVIESIPGQYEGFYAGLRDALRHGTEPPVKAEDALLTLKLIDLCRTSSQKRQVVSLS